ncbi:MAG: hypothetical protein ACHQQ3_00605 [Gemmatimonadales bacterium]
MADEPDWTLVTWEGNRLRQHREFQALTFRQKLQVIENLGEVTAYFALRARMRAAAVPESDGSNRASRSRIRAPQVESFAWTT